MQHIAQRVFLIHEECIKADKEKEGKAGKNKQKKNTRKDRRATSVIPQIRTMHGGGVQHGKCKDTQCWEQVQKSFS